MLFDQAGEFRLGFVITRFSAVSSHTLIIPFRPRYPRGWRERRARLEAK
jgi:hypothetical protein